MGKKERGTDGTSFISFIILLLSHSTLSAISRGAISILLFHLIENHINSDFPVFAWSHTILTRTHAWAKHTHPFTNAHMECSLFYSETVKFGHVTFFWNGNRSGYFNPAMEEYVEVPSDSGITFNVKPKMKALEIAEKARDAILSRKFDQVWLINP